MSEYEAPMITEIGSIADLTRGDSLNWDFDGMIFHSDSKGGGGGGGGGVGGYGGS